jgi:hypothetical protein
MGTSSISYHYACFWEPRLAEHHLELDLGRPCESQRGFGVSEAFGKDHGRIMRVFRVFVTL